MKKRVWIILICVILALCAAAAATWFFLLRTEQTVLYFNLDGYIYQNPNNTAISDRTADASGVYKIDFIANGAPVTCTTTDKNLVNQADSMQVVALQLGGNNQIKSVSAPKNLLADREFIQQIGDNELVLNTSFAFNGAQSTVRLAEGCRFYEIGNDGADTAPEIMDKVLIYGNALGQATDVFIMYRLPYSDLYWRLNRRYDAATDTTTRQPDEQGVYTIPFSISGEHVELKCKDSAIVADIDEPTSTNAAMGLVLDEEGYITQMMPAYRALRGRELCNTYDITSIDGNRIFVVNKQQDSLVGLRRQIVLSDDCKFFDVSSGAEVTGQQLSELLLNDRVNVYADALGLATHVFVRVRALDEPLYFNLLPLPAGERTGRTPDAEGWYHFPMLRDGEQVNLKTQDLSIASKIDTNTYRGMGLRVNGDVIESVYDVSCITGGGLLIGQRYVQSATEGLIISGNSSYKRLTATQVQKDCQIYDVSSFAGVPLGTKTTLRPGDCFIAFGNTDNQASHIYVVSRKR